MPHLVVDKNPVGSFKEKENMGKEGQTKAKGQTKAHARKSSNQGTFKEKDKPRHIQGKGQTKTNSRERTNQSIFKSIWGQTKAYSSPFKDNNGSIQGKGD